MNQYRTLIIDDEPAAREIIRTLLAETPAFVVVGEATNGSEAVAKILEHRPELIFLDIQMPKMDGFSVLRKIWAQHQPTVIFTTAYDQFALKAFEVSAIDYLLKPFDQTRFQQALMRAQERLLSRNYSKIENLLGQLLAAQTPDIPRDYLQRILVKDQSRMFFVELSQVKYLDADGNYITLHAGSGKHIIYDSLTHLETRLDPTAFVRIHRSYIVNINYIREVESHASGDHMVLLKTGESLKWTRHYRENLSAFLSKAS